MSALDVALTHGSRRPRVDLSYRRVAGLERIKGLVDAGALGDVFAVDVVFHNVYGPDKPWFYERALSGGGCLIDLGMHLVDAACFVLDDFSLTSVESRCFAAGRRLLPPVDEVEDYGVARLGLSRGAVVNLACSWRLHAGRDALIELSFYGTRGAASLENVNGSYLRLHRRALHRHGARGARAPARRLGRPSRGGVGGRARPQRRLRPKHRARRRSRAVHRRHLRPELSGAQ